MTLLQDDGFRNLRTKTAKSSIRRRPSNGVTDKGLERFLPTGVQKSYFMLPDAERVVLNTALGKYRPGQSEPILVGGKNLLKPALRLMRNYRLVIEEIKDSQAITSYTRWVDAVQVREAEVYLTSPDLQSAVRTHLALIQEASPGLCWPEAGPHWTREPVRSSDV